MYPKLGKGEETRGDIGIKEGKQAFILRGEKQELIIIESS